MRLLSSSLQLSVWNNFIRRSLSSKAFASNKKLIVQFPGQGSQFVGMAHDLGKQFRCAKNIMEEIDEALNISLSAIMREGSMVLIFDFCAYRELNHFRLYIQFILMVKRYT